MTGLIITSSFFPTMLFLNVIFWTNKCFFSWIKSWYSELRVIFFSVIVWSVESAFSQYLGGDFSLNLCVVCHVSNPTQTHLNSAGFSLIHHNTIHLPTIYLTDVLSDIQYKFFCRRDQLTSKVRSHCLLCMDGTKTEQRDEHFIFVYDVK